MISKVSLLILASSLVVACSQASTSAPIPTLDPAQQQGQAVFNLRCAQCHALLPETIVIGPSLAGIATRAARRVDGYDAETYIERSILNPEVYLVEGFPNTMPTNFGRELTIEEFDALVAYLMTLK